MVWCFQAPTGRAARRASSALPRCRGTGKPGDAAAAEFFQGIVDGELGVERRAGRVLPGGVAPVVGEGDDLAGLLGLGDVGVGIDHLGRGVVVSKNVSTLRVRSRPGRHVVLLQDRVVAVVADGVVIQVEAFLCGGQAQGRRRRTSPVSSCWLDSRRTR